MMHNKVLFCLDGQICMDGRLGTELETIQAQIRTACTTYHVQSRIGQARGPCEEREVRWFGSPCHNAGIGQRTKTAEMQWEKRHDVRRQETTGEGRGGSRRAMSKTAAVRWQRTTYNTGSVHIHIHGNVCLLCIVYICTCICTPSFLFNMLDMKGRGPDNASAAGDF